MAARRLRPGERLLDIRSAEGANREGYQVHSVRRDEAPERRILADLPPEDFTSRIAEPQGEVWISPLLESLRQRLHGRRR